MPYVAQPYSSARMDMWLFHVITTKRTYLAMNLAVNTFDTIVFGSEFPGKICKQKRILCNNNIFERSSRIEGKQGVSFSYKDKLILSKDSLSGNETK